MELTRSLVRLWRKDQNELYYPWDDYSGSEAEAVMNNCNDDMIKIMEGDY